MTSRSEGKRVIRAINRELERDGRDGLSDGLRDRAARYVNNVGESVGLESSRNDSDAYRLAHKRRERVARAIARGRN